MINRKLSSSGLAKILFTKTLNSKSFYTRLFLLLLTGSTISGCQTKVESLRFKPAEQIKHITLPASKLSAIFPISVRGDVSGDVNDSRLWVTASEVDGLWLINEHGDITAKTKGKYEGLDYRRIADQAFLVTLDKETGRPVVFSYNHKTPTDIFSNKITLDITNFDIESLCLYQDNANNMFLFLLDDRGGGELRWLLSGDHPSPLPPSSEKKKNNILDKKVKHLRLAPGITSCTVDDKSNSLIVVEEDFGVWRYNAHPEGSLARTLIQHRQTDKQDRPIAVRPLRNGAFLLLNENSIEQFSLTKETDLSASWQLNNSYPIQFEEAKDIAWSPLSAKFNALVLDEARDQLWFINLPVASQAKTAHHQNDEKSDQPFPTVTAKVETEPMDRFGDAADDSAIWVNPQNALQSRILATNKKWGLVVYDLQGNIVQSLPSGHINNIDIRQHIAVASNRSDNTMTFYQIHAENGTVQELNSIPTGLNDVYGICLYQPHADALYTFINDKDGRYYQYKLVIHKQEVKATLVREFSLPSQPEGCVADDTSGNLFVGEEDQGIWLYSAEPSASTEGKLILPLSSYLVADVEGLALIQNSTGHYLVASSQGNHSFAVFQADSPYAYLGSFRIGFNASLSIDGVSETDGIALSGLAFGKQFPQGLFIAQDGYNLMPEAPQNFKLVSWADIIKTLNFNTPH
ncbi:3-phytase [Thalassocella blandensis]|nr:3-phytase [Thalassocella blandensis]